MRDDRWYVVVAEYDVSSSVPRPNVILLLASKTYIMYSRKQLRSEKAKLGANTWFQRLCACVEREIREITGNYGGTLPGPTHDTSYIARAPVVRSRSPNYY